MSNSAATHYLCKLGAGLIVAGSLVAGAALTNDAHAAASFGRPGHVSSVNFATARIASNLRCSDCGRYGPFSGARHNLVQPAINPQPLPPRGGGEDWNRPIVDGHNLVRPTVNPQPLPPLHGENWSRPIVNGHNLVLPAINPQPLRRRTAATSSHQT